MFDVKDDLSQIQGLSKENLPARPKGWTATGHRLGLMGLGLVEIR